ncbi:hypothetical protein Gotur_033348, partial [Gossypium turneri]
MFFLVGKLLLLMDGFFEMPLGYQPSTSEEFFNMKHASAHNVIERCFGIDPIKAELGKGLPSNVINDDEPNIVNIHPSDAWATWRME